MKENLISDKSLIYQWYFNDNMSVVDNYRVKATVFGNPTYNNGIATFNGSTDYYKLKTLINLGTKYSIEVKFKMNIISNAIIIGKDVPNSYAIYIDASNNRIYTKASGSAVYISTTLNTSLNTLCIVRNLSTIEIYLNGIKQTVVGVHGGQNMLLSAIGGTEYGSSLFNGQIEYIKIWNRQLSPAEVKNNYNGKTYKSLPYKSTTLFHINSDNGVIRDLTGKTNPVATNVRLPKIGSNINVMKFDGLSGNVNIGSQALVGDITFMGWVNAINRGEIGDSRLLNNGQIIIRMDSSNNYVFSRNNNSNIYYSAANNIKFSNSQFICITSTSTGITNIYIGDKNNPPTLSGTANQSAGTPVAGGTCYLGNRASDDRTLNGWLNDYRMEQSILTLEEITQQWSNTKIKY